MRSWIYAADHKCAVVVSDAERFEAAVADEEEQEQVHICEAIKSYRDTSQVLNQTVSIIYKFRPQKNTNRLTLA